ncbi:hypothetical protein GOP47_0019084 [Adiantum capillus-veneris]|uniref:Uncharacterized protein n=1 Tax=Adiantum capillus-veneris TaxID=13818 RepID=A0A9D4ZAA6_ADICA|nr:hypothetical protein GOP47_0019084 [Adiantum capillus-veneris]
MGRAPCCEKVGLKRGPWTPEEDEKLVSFINQHGHGSWRALPKKAGLLRCGKSCRLRWTNYLRPDIKRGEFTTSEENAILQLHALLGNRWSAIASHLPKRTDNEIKNYWNTHLKKKLVKMGLDPVTHKPLADSVLMNNSCDIIEKSSGTHVDNRIGSSSSNKSSIVSGGDVKASSSCKDNACQLLLRGASPIVKVSPATMHLTQWESVRLEAEMRLTQEAKMRAKGVWRRKEGSGSACAGSVYNLSLFKASSSLLDAAATGSSMHSSALGALQAASAVELMHALHNWEKSLQGQAGVLWPESWRVVTGSCTPHSSESSSSSSPPAAAAPACTSSASLDHESLKKQQQQQQQPISASEQRIPTSTTCNAAPTPISACLSKKLSWSDALMPPKDPSGKPPSHEFYNLETSRSLGSGSFSSLMLDAVLGRSSLAQGSNAAKVISVEGHVCCGAKEEPRSSDARMKSTATAAAYDRSDKPNVDEASNVSAVTGDMQDNDDDDTCSNNEEEDEDENEEDEESSLSVDGTSDLFKDLPRLKRDATTTPVSYTAMLSEEISDYWSNIVLKEQVSSPTIHMTF